MLDQNYTDDLIFEELDYDESSLKSKEGLFDGNLTEKELCNLIEAGFSEKEINFIKENIYKYREHLTGFVDLIGDNPAPSKLFLHNIKHYGYLLQDDPDKVISKKSVLFRKYISGQIIKTLGPLFLASKQIFENRNELVNGSYQKDKGIIIPKEPVIWTPNHHFKDDALSTIIAEKRPSYMVFGSLPEFYNTFNGILGNLEGVLLINRKVKSSRNALEPKVDKAISLGADIFLCTEGVWNKTPNKYLLEIWHSVYRLAINNGVKVVPVVHYVYDPSRMIDRKINPIHTVVDDPIDFTKFSEEAGLRYYRDVMATWYHLMAEKYGKTTREQLMDYYTNRALLYNSKLRKEDFEQRNITSHEAWEVFLLDLMQTANWYDSSIEHSADYRDKNNVRAEDAFKSIANIKNTTPENVWDVIEAKKLVRTREMEDYQRRF
ncbi:MAG: hypothetical protein ACI31M_01915 [Bacilli bacterium]